MMITQRSNKYINQYGAVSLFIVIFTALLMTIVTISFVQLMTSDQRQATNSDLSESAYDSAQAGVEDAKRLLLLSKACEDGTADSSVNCADVTSALTPVPGEDQTHCDTLVRAGLVSGANNETVLQQQSSDARLNQAYTCVKVQPDTRDFLGSIHPDMSPVLVPLKGVDPIDRVVVSWWINKDGGAVDLPPAGNPRLPVMGALWPQNRPTLLRAQFINGQGSFNLSDFDSSGYSDTLFLYPSDAGSTSANFAIDSRRTTALGSRPREIRCNPGVGSGDYVCRATLSLTSPVDAGSETAFLSLGGFYNATDFKVELMSGAGGTIVPFDGVQPEIDSTGRASDLFRRVVSRVEMGGSFNYPQAAIETSGRLCKNFSVTTESADYNNRCTP